MTRPSRTGVRGLVVTADGRRAIDLRYRAPDGRELRYKEALAPGTSARTAEARAREVLTAAYAGALVPRRQRAAATFRAAWDVYLTWVAINRPKAYRQRENIAKTWVRVVGNVDVLAVDAALCERYKAARASSAPATVNKGLRTLRHMAGLSAKGVIAAGITREREWILRGVPLLREPPGRQRPIAPHELDAIMTAFTKRGDSRFAGRVVRAALLTGMRLGEVLELTHDRVRGKGAAAVIDLTHTKQNRSHQIPASPAFLALVEEARADHPGGTYTVGGALVVGTYTVVFPNRHGNAYTVDGFSKHFARIAERAGVESITFHDLRRHVGTTLINAGERLEVVSKLLGHATVGVTQRSYAHLTTEATRGAVDVLAGNAPALPPRGKTKRRVRVE